MKNSSDWEQLWSGLTQKIKPLKINVRVHVKFYNNLLSYFFNFFDFVIIY